MTMRWLLTWKPSPDGARKAKARIIIRGFEDPDLLDLQKQSPTCSRLSKLLALQMAAQQRWKVELANAHAAFLQGSNSETARKVYCFAVPELAIALGVSQHRMVQVHKACYGLANAPKEWWASVSDRFEKIGLKRLRADQCVWIGSTPSGETCTVIIVMWTIS